MDLSQPPIITELEEAMGNLLHLFQLAANMHRDAIFEHRAAHMPHQIDPATFHASWSVLNAQDFEVAQHCIDVLFGIYLPAGNASSWFPDRDDPTIAPNPHAWKRKKRKP